MIRILYLSRINLLSSRTNVYNLAKTCEALAGKGEVRVTLVTTDQKRDTEAFFRKMGVHRPFEVVCLGATDTSSTFAGARWYEAWTFIVANLRLIGFVFMHRTEFDVLYFRDESLSPTAFLARMFLRKHTFFEIHSVLENRVRQVINKFAARFASGIVAISGGLQRYYRAYNKNILLSLCSAAEDSWFDHSRDRSAFREQLGLPRDAFLIGYTGVVGANPNNDYYEIDDIVRSLAFLPERVVCVVVGEVHRNGEWLRRIAEDAGVSHRLIILPWQERSEIPKYLQAFDVNLIPKRKKDLVGDSPAKMFPALASRRPIVAGRAECIEEVLTNGVDALIVEHNTKEGWANAILKLYTDQTLAEELSRHAWDTHEKYTWEKRGVAIAHFIRETLTRT